MGPGYVSRIYTSDAAKALAELLYGSDTTMENNAIDSPKCTPQKSGDKYDECAAKRSATSMATGQATTCLILRLISIGWLCLYPLT
jgi:hypothetical protein